MGAFFLVEMIAWVPHDDGPSLAFPSLQSFLEALGQESPEGRYWEGHVLAKKAWFATQAGRSPGQIEAGVELLQAAQQYEYPPGPHTEWTDEQDVQNLVHEQSMNCGATLIHATRLDLLEAMLERDMDTFTCARDRFASMQDPAAVALRAKVESSLNDLGERR